MSWMDRFVVEGVRAARRLVIAVVGATVLMVGLALLVLPGPAFVVIPIGIGILAIEFEWARRLLKRAQHFYRESLQTDRSPSSTANEVDSGDASRSP